MKSPSAKGAKTHPFEHGVVNNTSNLIGYRNDRPSALALTRTRSFEMYQTGISTSPSFHKLNYLCSKHDPTILKSVLRDALDECTEAAKTMQKEKASKKREAEITWF